MNISIVGLSKQMYTKVIDHCASFGIYYHGEVNNTGRRVADNYYNVWPVLVAHDTGTKYLVGYKRANNPNYNLHEFFKALSIPAMTTELGNTPHIL